MAKHLFDREKPHQQGQTHYHVVKYLIDLASFHGKTYCYPAQKTICKGLEYSNIHIGRRMLNYVLHDLVVSGQIKRRRRHRRNRFGMLEMHSTLYIVTGKGRGLVARWIAKLTGNFDMIKKKMKFPVAAKDPRLTADEAKGFIEQLRDRLPGALDFDPMPG